MLIDLSRCPKCNGPADNGHDREAPPNPYYCTKCMAEPTTEESSAAEPVQELVQEPLPTSDEAAAHVLARLSKTPAEAYERGYMDGHSRGVEVERERYARICDNLDVMSRDPVVCRGSAQECAEAIRDTLAEPVQEPVAQISANRVIAAIEEWKSLWWKVPPFASKVNRATREAITVSHNPLFALLLDAQAAKQMPRGCATPSGCQQHGCHGDCLPTEPQRPAEPVGVVTSMVKGGVTWRRWPADMPDGTRLFSEVQP